MEKVAAPPSSRGISSMVKRKTPSELRGEQLKRESVEDLTDDDDDEVSPSAGSAKDTQLIGEVFSAKKSMFRIVSKEQTSSNLKNDAKGQAGETNEKFLSVADLSSSAVGRSSGGAATAGINMGQALKGLASLVNSAEPTIAGENSFSGCHITISGKNAPLDLTLKTSMRIVFYSASANWNENIRGFKDLHSWMYPQSVIPSSIISVLNSSTAEEELEFLRKRQVGWEESFRDLFYMLRNKVCGLFYVCTSQFVVMFTGGDGSRKSKSKSKCSCNAYISQSTRGLRSLLREHDLCFSMPLCRSKVDQEVTIAEDLAELSEIEKQNLGEIRRQRSSDVDNSPESLLVFSGNNNVHGLYDLLLNYKTLLTSLSGVEDVPVLCSPVPFQNSAMTSPDIKCMKMTRAENIAQGSSNGLFYSIEIKDAIIPPWIICSICASMMGSQGIRNFEASFVTEPL